MLKSLHLLLKESILLQCIRQLKHKNVKRDFNKQQINFYNATVCNFSTVNVYNTKNKRTDSSIEDIQLGNDIIPSNEGIALQSWLDMYKFNGGVVPETISEKQMEILTQKFQQNTYQTIKYLRFLFVRELRDKKDAIKAKERKEILKEKRSTFELENNGHIIHRLWHNSMYGRVFRQTVNNLDHHRLCNALQYGQPLIIDLGFDCHSYAREVSSLHKELIISIKENSRNLDPFNLYLCNLRDEKLTQLEEKVQILGDPTFPINITSQSYLDLFPKSKLIYLTPDSKNVMKKFDHNAIYIIGGIVDLRRQDPLSLAKAKREGITTMKLPLQNYLDFKHRSPLGIHIMMAIMLELQTSGNFKKAFEYVPRRLLKSPDYKFGESPWDQKSNLKTIKSLSNN